jgi:hypothetical protein
MGTVRGLVLLALVVLYMDLTSGFFQPSSRLLRMRWDNLEGSLTPLESASMKVAPGQVSAVLPCTTFTQTNT